MNLQERNLSFDRRGADVRLLQFELGLLDLNISDEEVAANHFGEGTREAVLKLQEEFGLEADGVVDEVTAERINAKLRQLIPMDKGLEQLARSVKLTLEQIDELTPTTDDLRVQIKRFSEIIKAFLLALDMFQEWGASKDQVKQVEKMLTARQKQLTKLASSLDDELEEAKERSSVVSGKVQREDSLPLKGVKVRASHEVELGSIHLGEDMTDAQGHYTIRYELLPGVDGVNLKISAIGDDGETVVSSQVVSNAKPIETIDLVVPITAPASNRQTIEGAILLEHGLPAEKLKLRLYRHDFGGKATLLDATTTVGDGRYAFSYDAGGHAASLEIRAVKPDGEEVPLSRSLNELTAESRVRLNLLAPGNLQPLSAEYRRLSADLTPLVGKMAELAFAKEDAQQQDLSVLNRATGWDARLIALASATERLAADIDVPAEALYGLLRAGLPFDKLLLAQVEPDVAEMAIRKARDAGVVEIDDAGVAVLKTKFTAFANKMRLAMSVPGSRTTYGALLKASGLPQDAQEKFAPIYLKHRGDGAQLWEEARKAGLDGTQVRKLQLQGKFAFLAGNSEAMTVRLMEKQMDDPAALIEEGFHRADEWINEILKQARIPFSRRENLTDVDKKKLADLIPIAYGAEKVEDRLNAYAEDMARKLRLSYPTQVVERLMETDDNFKSFAANPATVTLLKNASAHGFRLGETPVTTFFRDHAEVVEDIDNAEVQIAQLQQLQRIYQLTPSNDAMPVLMQLDITSAFDLMAYPKEQFISLFKAKYIEIYNTPAPDGVPELIATKAQQISSVTYNLFAIAKKLDSEPHVAGISSSLQVRESVKNELIKHFPTMESMLGSMDYCECEHCRSVLSPAAYMVDLLQFVDTEPGVWGNFLANWKKTHGDREYPHKNAAGDAMRPYDALIERRPDLPHIALSCENTHTALPYIDIVNEILEYYVANGKLAKDAVHDTGDATTDQLLAEPQNVIREAYDTLRKTRYPLNLPFDLWLETVRKFCDYFETPLWQVLKTFRQSDDLFGPTAAYDWAAIFFESLGLSPSEVAIFTSPAPLSEWFMLYGFETSAMALDEAVDAETGQRVDLNSAKALARRLDVTYKEITAIVQTAFVNPELSDLALLYKLGMTIADARAYTKNKALYDQNQDIVGKRRADLSPADQQRFDGLTKKLANSQLTGWDVVNEVAAVEHRLSELVTTFNTPLNDLQAAIQAIPYDRVLLLVDPDTGCNFDQTMLQYADGTQADAIIFLRINLFVRLWRKLGWSIEETDRALSTFTPKTAPYDNNPANLAKQPLQTVLIYLAHMQAFNQAVRVGKQNRLKILTLWSNIPTTGKQSLYAQLFLTRSARKSAEVEVMVAGNPRRLSVFDDPFGRYLEPNQLARLADQVRYEVRLPGVKAADQINAAAFAGEDRIGLRYDDLGEVQYLNYIGVLTDAEKDRLAGLATVDALSTLLSSVQVKAAEFRLIKGHMLVLQGALGLTADEIGAILVDVDTSLDEAMLTLPNVSTLYRYVLLAKALKLSMSELIALKRLSGFDPFKPLHTDPLTTLDQDYPLSQTLGFVKVAEEVKDSGFNIEDLEHLLQHRFNSFDNYRQNGETMSALTKTLAEGIRAILAEHAVPADSGAPTDDILRQKLGLALPSDVAERFWAMLNGTAEFTVTKQAVTENNHLPATSFVGELAISQVAYNAIRQEQKLVFRGVMFDAQKTELKDKFSAMLTAGQRATFTALLDAAQIEANKQASEFFTKHLQEQTLTASATTGFLKEEDFDKLFEPVPTIKDDLPEDQKQIARKDNNEKLREKRTRLTTTFLPFLQRRLIRQLVVQTLTASTGADASLVESLLMDRTLLADPTQNTQPLLNAFVAIGKPGVSARFYVEPMPPPESADPAAPSVLLADADTSLKDGAGNSLKPPGTNSARLEGWLEVPAAGVYRFFAELDKKDAEAELSFAHLPGPVFTGKATQDNEELGKKEKEYVELKPGVPYHFTLELRNLDGSDAQLRVQGETLPKDWLAQLTLYTESAVQRSGRAQVLLTKALQLLQTLGLNERELRYISRHADDFDGVSLSALPTQDSDNTGALTFTLFKQFLRLAAYARLKRDLAGGTDDLIGIFEANGTAAPDRLDKVVYSLIGQLTRHDETTVKVVARALAEQPSFASEEPLERLWAALQVVERFQVPVASLLEWTRIVSTKASPTQYPEIASNLKEAIKACFEQETWQRVAQPIFDKLRARQRDALASYVMHQHGFDRLEQLYEYFLIDPGMEPVVQTSRIRLANASLQLFIQRCLLNLEPKVQPSTINSKQWEWMNRYRVWEANRKIFLFPENWLEPEFRDDKTHLFSEFEGALLQGDVSRELVEDAFLNYLKKLDELARLDICAMHIEDNVDSALRTLHVFGRTYSQPHKYFYRRYAHQMWSPWEPVSTEIEGDHLAPVIWRDRLYLFWITFLEKAQQPAGNTTIDDTMKRIVIPAPKKDVEAYLHWSEYVEGKWTTRESGGLTSPSAVVARGLNWFNPKSVFVHVTKELYEDGEEGGVFVHLHHPFQHAFYLAGRNSAPERGEYTDKPANPFSSANIGIANRYKGNGPLKVSFKEWITTEPGKTPPSVNPNILKKGKNYTLLPCNNHLTALGVSKDAYRGATNPNAVEAAIRNSVGEIATLMKPVFYQDNRHTFFVEPNLTETTIEKWQEWVTRTPKPNHELNPDIVIIPDIPRKWPIPMPDDDWLSKIHHDSLINPILDRDWLINPVSAINRDKVLIGPFGQAGIEIRDATDSAIGLGRVNVNAGSELASGSSIMMSDAESFERSGLREIGGGLNIVGAAGLNSALEKNFTDLNQSSFDAGVLASVRTKRG
ncbi:neuraminidase-like domain-containing protein [Psychrobacter sp. GP33]|uniref:neuraminidase-like domain-containing protein n=1 Tax=Psychrobacter sp. GP33 TaxID=2758709 RepID=UPI0015F8E923|nr:neuraminidase-like domain-containing protein [Psychrobacter sp. GP33]